MNKYHPERLKFTSEDLINILGRKYYLKRDNPNLGLKV